LFLFLQLKDEAWWLVLGNTSTSELHALKRVSFTDHLVTHMELPSTLTSVQVNLPSFKVMLIGILFVCREPSFKVMVFTHHVCNWLFFIVGICFFFPLGILFFKKKKKKKIGFILFLKKLDT